MMPPCQLHVVMPSSSHKVLAIKPFHSMNSHPTYVQGRVQYMVDKVEQVREVSLVMESGSVVPCDVLVNAREPRLWSGTVVESPR